MKKKEKKKERTKKKKKERNRKIRNRKKSFFKILEHLRLSCSSQPPTLLLLPSLGHVLDTLTHLLPLPEPKLPPFLPLLHSPSHLFRVFFRGDPTIASSLYHYLWKWIKLIFPGKVKERSEGREGNGNES